MRRLNPRPIVSAVLAAVVLHTMVASADAQNLTATQVSSGLALPVCTRVPPGDHHRLFVVDRLGRISIIKDGVFLGPAFLDIVSEVYFASGEAGLLGLAFHPDYASNGRFFVSFVQAGSRDVIVREYHVSADPDVADPASAVTIFGPYLHTAGIHYGSDLQFGPDGMLYFSFGDNSSGQPQNLNTYYGKILRLDVDVPAPHVPADNPYAAPGDGALDLIWAIGLRNPWRFSFDRLTGDMYIGDVGAGAREEVDFQPATFGTSGSPAYGGGRNYGWKCMEGSLCTTVTDCTCDTTGATLTLPVVEWQHTTGFQLSTVGAVIGGYVYRGSKIPGIQGRYFCGDYTGRVWTFVMSNGHATQLRDWTAELVTLAGNPLGTLSSFGEDADGELYLTVIGQGKVYRIDSSVGGCPAPQTYCTTTPNSVGSGARIGSTGTSSIEHHELVLTAAHCPRNKPGVFFHGAQQTQVAFANGVRCVGGGLVRTSIVVTDEHGFAHRPFDAIAAGMTAGQTRNFQFYFRDPAAGGAFANLSDALSVTFCP